VIALRTFIPVAILSCVAASVAAAYAVGAPRLMIAASPDGSALLRIDPGAWGREEMARPAQATVYRYDTGSKGYRVTGSFALRNPVAPMTAVISNGAAFVVTCDDYDPAIGSTPNVVVVYRGSGELVKAWALEDIFSSAEIERFGPFPDNVPVWRWRGEKVSFMGDSKSVWIPAGRDLPWHVSLRLDLVSLTFQKYPERDSDK
jgi:hypothetical protein